MNILLPALQKDILFGFFSLAALVALYSYVDFSQWKGRVIQYGFLIVSILLGYWLITAQDAYSFSMRCGLISFLYASFFISNREVFTLLKRFLIADCLIFLGGFFVEFLERSLGDKYAPLFFPILKDVAVLFVMFGIVLKIPSGALMASVFKKNTSTVVMFLSQVLIPVCCMVSFLKLAVRSPIVLSYWVKYIGMAFLLVGLIKSLIEVSFPKILSRFILGFFGCFFFFLGQKCWLAIIFLILIYTFFVPLLSWLLGNVTRSTSGEQHLDRLGGLQNKIPLTYFFSLLVLGVFVFLSLSFFLLVIPACVKNFLQTCLVLMSFTVLGSLSIFRVVYNVFKKPFCFDEHVETYVREVNVFQQLPVLFGILGCFCFMYLFCYRFFFCFLDYKLVPILYRWTVFGLCLGVIGTFVGCFSILVQDSFLQKVKDCHEQNKRMFFQRILSFTRTLALSKDFFRKIKDLKKSVFSFCFTEMEHFKDDQIRRFESWFGKFESLFLESLSVNLKSIFVCVFFLVLLGCFWK